MILVYDKNKQFIVALDLNGNRNTYITNLNKGSGLSITIAINPADIGKLEDNWVDGFAI